LNRHSPFPRSNDLYALASPSTADRNYFATALRTFGVFYDLLPEALAKIPSTGPLIVVANHPFGAIDGLIMGDILTQSRPDFRLLANRLLHRIPEFRPWILPVDHPWATTRPPSATPHSFGWHEVVGPRRCAGHLSGRDGIASTLEAGLHR